MHTYKLTYFDLRGLGEMIRLTFAQAGVKFEDHRVQMDSTDWKSGFALLVLKFYFFVY